MAAATQQTASTWAGRFKLDPERVAVGRNAALTIPQHILYSPKGQTLYRREGLHTEDLIRATLAKHKKAWRDWSAQQARW